jgi:isovaleryl-CoA dehydrogenase
MTATALVRDFTDEQQAFRAAIRDFAARECGTQEQRRRLTDDGELLHNQALYERIAELGWIGVALPEEQGGGGGGVVDQCLMLEEAHIGKLPIGAIRTSLIVAGNYLRAGAEFQKEQMLPAICSGRVQAIAMSEPEAGSDVANIRCRAEKADGGWVIDGHKTWCTNAHIADRILVVCRTDTSQGKHHGLTMLDVPADHAALSMSRITTMNGRETNDLYFTECFVPDSAVVGAVDGAWKQLMGGLNLERLILAATMLGVTQGALDDALRYITERRQFGQPIGSFQAVKHRFVDLATEVEVCRLLVYAVARKVDDDPTRMLPREASMAKLKMTEVARRVTLDCIQMMGGYGYAKEYEVEQAARQAIGSTIYAGTNEIQREIIAKTYGL